MNILSFIKLVTTPPIVDGIMMSDFEFEKLKPQRAMNVLWVKNSSQTLSKELKEKKDILDVMSAISGFQNWETMKKDDKKNEMRHIEYSEFASTIDLEALNINQNLQLPFTMKIYETFSKKNKETVIKFMKKYPMLSTFIYASPEYDDHKFENMDDLKNFIIENGFSCKKFAPEMSLEGLDPKIFDLIQKWSVHLNINNKIHDEYGFPIPRDIKNTIGYLRDYLKMLSRCGTHFTVKPRDVETLKSISDFYNEYIVQYEGHKKGDYLVKFSNATFREFSSGEMICLLKGCDVGWNTYAKKMHEIFEYEGTPSSDIMIPYSKSIKDAYGDSYEEIIRKDMIEMGLHDFFVRAKEKVDQRRNYTPPAEPEEQDFSPKP